MITNSLYVLTILCLIVSGSEWLVRNSFLKHFGTALLVILVTAIIANLGILQAGSSAERPVPTYDAIFTYLAPISIFWLLLRVNLKAILKAGIPTLVLFVIGSLATACGVVVGMLVVNGPEAIGENYNAVGGMFVGTYTGGSINFNAIALNYNIMQEGVLYGSSVVVDNIITTVWMITTLAMPKLLSRFWPEKEGGSTASTQPDLGVEEDTEDLHPMDIGVVLALGMAALFLSNLLADSFRELGFNVPSIIIITTFALIIAQLPIAQKIKGAQVLGMFSVYIFLAVIGAFCDVNALMEVGNLGVALLIFALVIVIVHGLITFGAARIMKVDLVTASMISQANVGGGTSALALARSLGRSDLVLPAVLLGSLGNALGTFLGFWVAEYVLPALF